MPDELRGEGGFKASVLEDLEKEGEKIGLKGLIREYMEGLWDVHSEIRGKLRDKILEMETVVNVAVARYQRDFPEVDSIIGLSAVMRDPDGDSIEILSMSTESHKYRKYLEAKNTGLQKLSMRYVTGEVCSSP